MGFPLPNMVIFTFGVFLLVLANHHVTSAPTATECVVQQNGCSIPLDLPFFYKKSFTPACERHDVCYSCGAHYGWSRNECDVGFRSYMYSVCDDKKSKRFLDDLVDWINGWKDPVTRCKRVADIYYISVDTFARNNFEKVSPEWCKTHVPENWVTQIFRCKYNNKWINLSDEVVGLVNFGLLQGISANKKVERLGRGNYRRSFLHSISS